MTLRGDFALVNDSLCDMLGRSREELIGASYRILMDEPHAKRTAQAFKEVFQTGKPRRGFRYEIVTRSGEPRSLEISISTIKDSDGSVSGFRGIVRDMTESRRAEEAVQFEKQRFRSLAEQAPLGIVMVGKEGEFRYVNPKFVELFGYEPQDVPNGVEWFLKAFPDPEYRHAAISAWKEYVTSGALGEYTPVVFNVCCKDGSYKTIRFRAVRLDSSDHIMTCEDISDLKRAESNLSAELQTGESWM